MPGGQPSLNDLHIDALLSTLSIAYMNEPDAFIADKLFPIITVAKQSNKIATYNKEYWFRNEAGIRGPGTESKGGGYETSTTTYYCDNYAWHEDIPDEDRKNYDAPFDPDADATALVMEKLKLCREVLWAGDFFVTGVWGTSYDVSVSSVVWSDWANSDPITDTETAREAIYSSTGREPKDLLYGRNVWRYIKHHPDFLERIKYTQRGVLTAELVAAILDVDRLHIGKSIYTSTKEGQTASYSYVFGNNALLFYVPPRPGLRTPSAGYTFHWNVFGGISYVRRVRDDKAMYDRIEGHTFLDQKILGTDLGYMMLNVV